MFDQIEETKLAAFYDEMTKEAGILDLIRKYPVGATLAATGAAAAAPFAAPLIAGAFPAIAPAIGSLAGTAASASPYIAATGLMGLGVKSMAQSLSKTPDLGKSLKNSIGRLLGFKSSRNTPTMYSKAADDIKKLMNSGSLDPAGVTAMQDRHDWNMRMHELAVMDPQNAALIRQSDPTLNAASYADYAKIRNANSDLQKNYNELNTAAAGAGVTKNTTTGKYEYDAAKGLLEQAKRNPGHAAAGVGAALLGLEGARRLAGDAFGDENNKKKGVVVVNS